METHSSPAAVDRLSPLAGSADSATDAVAALHPSLPGERLADRIRSAAIVFGFTFLGVVLLLTAVDAVLDWLF
jgi:hypothetical protein